MGEKRDKEQEPLLSPRAAQAFTKDTPVAVCSEAPKKWDGGILNCCGSCDLPGCATFGLVQTCPCFAWGHNLKRAFKSSLLLHATIYFVLFVFASHLYLGANQAEMMLCPDGPLDEASFMEKLADNGNRRLLHDHGMHEHGPGEHHGKPPVPTPWADLPEECQAAIFMKYETLSLCIICFLIGVAYCSYNRTMLRQKFGIAGSRFGDFCTWCWCAPCALCQETRTIWSNNVVEGVWHGPTQLPTVTPPAQQSVVGLPVPKQV
ncbi:hypothetical protein COCSUDRAFT_54324 [Coccomyxa subellipsoidea C-169]|uniref:PLAC8-domain-containing protein n=1 Tax=Coccomyxa subellipsoidea (strain C-169) TaxID=574566 RepID=I0YPX7_COCSC|nr:hypothetical protein COCSUDRAFT_54324 [Coccomyxa subellipsoidea C-169]EIE20446.1 hypothetical protein COCSUDRAFT_54324 [Coccomyxa subellipsoidea C-169]|eukprot:XP_005644990.1 hypothetical protein COCSUDRAFT_54324 [Coccomyxa subellipsoidea C-169]